MTDDEFEKHKRIDIRIQQLGSKFITIIEGLAEDLDLKILLKTLIKNLHCNGNIIDEKIIQLQGDHRNKIYKFLIEEKIIPKEFIKIHGF